MSPRTNCGWCEAWVGMQRVTHPELPVGSAFDYNHRRGGPTHWVMFVCPACHIPSLAEVAESPGGELTVIGWYPKTPPTHAYPESVPRNIAGAAQEAHSSLGIGNVQAAVLMARTTIEASAKAKGIVQGNLVAKIDSLYAQHLIYEHVRDAAHEVRHFGNDAAHADLVDSPLSEEEAGEVLELMDMVLDGVFIAPAKTAAVKAARLAKKAAQAPQTP